MKHTPLARLAHIYCPCLLPAVLLVVLSSCSGTAVKNAPPPVWTHYQGNTFALGYFSNWSVSTKDLYLGTRYPPLEMLQGETFTRNNAATAFLQVVYAMPTNSKASAQDIMLKFLLNSSPQAAAPSSLSKITLAQETWYQGSVEKQVKQSNGTPLTIKQTALGIDRKNSAGKAEVYLIIYQDSTDTYAQDTHDFFERMVNSFQFV